MTREAAERIRVILEANIIDWPNASDECFADVEACLRAYLAREAVAELREENERLREACKLALEVLPGLEVRSWPPGHEMKRKAIQQLQSALGIVKGSK